MRTKIQVEITPLWSVISEVKERIKIAMEGMQRENTDFTIMVASELLENAIKYGVSNKEIPQIIFDFKLDEKSIAIKVKNGISENPCLEEFTQMMDKITKTENKKDLYMERLQEILESPASDVSHLGLYRIVSEGNFDLVYSVSENALEILATKKI